MIDMRSATERREALKAEKFSQRGSTKEQQG